MALLEAREVSVRFGGHQAVDQVDLQVEAGRVTGLIGPNGAGKTTIFNALTGLQETAGGQVLIDGEDVTGLAPHKRARRGMARTFQRLELFSLLTVRENVLVGAEGRQRWSKDKAQKPEDVVDEVLERIGLADIADQRVDSLPTGKARLVELARALASRPRVLLLDEPSSGLNEGETTEMAAVLRQVADEGLAVLLVEHDMSLVMGVCEEIFVLDFGQIIATGDPTAIQSDPVVQEAYLGAVAESAAEEHLATPVPVVSDPIPGDDQVPTGPVPLLGVNDLRAAYGDIDVLHGVDFDVHAGSVFALLGPNGAGKSTTLKVISGLLAPTGGSVSLLGRRVTGADADALARAGVCLVPEGRGVFPNLTVTENLRMATYTGTPFDEVLDRSFRRFPRLAERRGQVAGTMSGGEQQMLAMARALATDPAVLLLDELSMGLAPIIVSGLYEQVQAIADEGTTILVVEQFAHEVLGVADVAAIMLHGRVQRIGRPAEIGEELAAAYLGGSA
ncbi:MAG TPA: ATP-binding cassette domain-containing protein [Acidimicrobiales bacterium]|nr:ATP-binding cassette domain-containing protein [Acidimicrobiales bacterium]